MPNFRSKCNCGKKATSEWLVCDKKTTWTVILCDNCKPKERYNTDKMTLIYGK